MLRAILLFNIHKVLSLWEDDSDNNKVAKGVADLPIVIQRSSTVAVKLYIGEWVRMLNMLYENDISKLVSIYAVLVDITHHLLFS